MSAEGLVFYDHKAQVRLVDESVHDATPAVPTGYESIDSLLRRGGLLPGSLALLGGRTGTRKTTVALNFVLAAAKQGIPVGWVGLDERPWMYSAKMMGLYAGVTPEWLEENWDTPAGQQIQREWKAFADGLVHVFGGRRPSPEHLTGQLEMTAMGSSNPPKLLVVDYLSLMTRGGKYGYGENDRLARLAEELAVWATEANVALLVLHQLSRNDEFGGANNRNNGHLPGTLTQLKYAGEDPADYVMFTYRPSKNPLANMTMPVARQVLGDRFDEEEFWELRALCKKYDRSTFVQLLKNRPGTRTEEKGVELLSPDASLRMAEKEPEEESEVEEMEEAIRRGD